LTQAVALLGRFLVIAFAFVIASTVAAAVLTLGVLAPDWYDAMDRGMATGAISLVVGFTAFFVTGLAFLPMLLIILVAESFGWRSVLVYATAGLGLALFFRSLLTFQGQDFFGRDFEIMAAAGIAAGLVYWMLAGRNAGRWWGLH
jgi:hypothetical protein